MSANHAASLALICLLTACTPDQQVYALKRELSTSLATFDAGQVAVGDRETIKIFLNSTGAGEVSIFDVYVEEEDEAFWQISPNWMTEDFDDDQVADGQIVDGGSSSDPSYGLIEVIFKPEAEDQYRTTLTIVSNDTEVSERTEEDDFGVWRVVLRGIGRYPCGIIYPDFHDFGPRPAGGYFSSSSTIENCGVVTLTISDFDLSHTNADNKAFSIDTPTPIYVLPQSTEEVEFAYVPSGGVLRRRPSSPSTPMIRIWTPPFIYKAMTVKTRSMKIGTTTPKTVGLNAVATVTIQ